MCGICGFWIAAPGPTSEELVAGTWGMAAALAHRGPNDSGAWVEVEAGLALGHRRLSVIDLSPLGHQPMVSGSGRHVISYNGEIYNFAELRCDLEIAGIGFRGHSDTEVLLEGIEAWGIEQTLQRVNGMFALAVWDRREHVLTLARDRAGKKPLYYGWCERTMMFASELKAFRCNPAFTAEIDRDALGLFIQYGWLPSPHTIYRGARQLPPGAFLRLTHSRDRNAEPIRYWNACATCAASERVPFTGGLDEAVDKLQALLREAVRDRMVSDVPLGALLSGGIDSTSVVATMQAVSAQPVRTFTIGFGDKAYNEAEHARAIADYLGTEHTELYISPADAQKVIPRIASLYDEPFADVSQIPTFIVCELARQQVTVVLSGDGGDELFAGYNTYATSERHWSKLARKPLVRRRAEARMRGFAGNLLWNVSGGRPMPYDRGKGERLGARMLRKGRGLPACSLIDLYVHRYRARVDDPTELVVGAGHARTFLNDPAAWPQLREPLRVLMLFDFVSYLTDDLLVKVDRASMGVGLEVRCPLLDRRIVEFAWHLPSALLYGPDGGKRVLRAALARIVPSALTDRPKAGFAVPIVDWLRGPLRDWSEALLAPERLKREGFLNPAVVTRIWRQNLTGWYTDGQLIWSILMFQLWLERWGRISAG